MQPVILSAAKNLALLTECTGSKKLDTDLGVENNIPVNSSDDVRLETVTKAKDSHRL